MDRVYRLNLINSITGFKPANLIGTKSESGIPNLAIVSSVVHLSSSPAMLGFIQRPTHIQRHTYQNIKETGVYSVNHVHTSMIEQAHCTSAKFAFEESEFEKCGLTEAYTDDFYAPMVEESFVNIAMSYVEEYNIQASNTILLVGRVEFISLPEDAITSFGELDLNRVMTASISGLNNYHESKQIQRIPYARPENYENSF
jgi:flavin reductase (DIM6/NTAB) family NADH-FMN oxidoreductase RutF